MTGLAILVAVLNTVESPDAEGVSIKAIAPAPLTEAQYIGFEVRVPWIDGYIRVRFPENIESRLGLHFLDIEPSIPRVSKVSVPTWSRDEAGRLSYEVVTEEGFSWSGAAWIEADVVEMRFAVKNQTGQEQDVNAQICIDMTTAPPLSERDRLDTTFAWFNGGYRSLAEATSEKSKREETGFNWVLMLYKSNPDEQLRAIEQSYPWWILNEQADYPVIARGTPDGRHLVAVTWDDTVRRLMTNTNAPCMHADPMHCENLPNGGSHEWRGRLFLMENDPKRLLERCRERSTSTSTNWNLETSKD